MEINIGININVIHNNNVVSRLLQLARTSSFEINPKKLAQIKGVFFFTRDSLAFIMKTVEYFLRFNSFCALKLPKRSRIEYRNSSTWNQWRTNIGRVHENSKSSQSEHKSQPIGLHGLWVSTGIIVFATTQRPC